MQGGEEVEEEEDGWGGGLEREGQTETDSKG